MSQWTLPRPYRPGLRRLVLVLLWTLAGHPAVAADDAPTNVRTLPLRELLSSPQYSAPASVVARNRPQVAAEIEARILDLPVDVGDRVEAGTTLARLDCRRYESALATARAELRRAEAQRQFAAAQQQRAQNLTKKQSISEELLDQRRTDLSTAEADTAARRESVVRAAIDVDNCTLRAPFAAVVSARPASIGGLARPGEVVVELLETAGQEVSVMLRNDQVDGVVAAASLTFETNGGRLAVALRAVLPAADPIARTREARLVFAGPPALAGTAGRLVWQGDGAQLPADYLVRRDGRLGIFLLEQGRARFVPIPGAEDGRPAPIDLDPRASLITDGRQALGDGDPVHVVPTAETR